MDDIETIARKYRAIEDRKLSGANSERAALVQEFVDEINKEREGTAYKPIHGRAVAMKLSHVKRLSDLYAFLSACREYKAKGKGEFGKAFFGALKQK